MNTDWCKNFQDRIYIKAETGTVDLRINSLISVILGEPSNNSKALFIFLEALKEIYTNRIIESNINLDDMIVCKNEKEIGYLLRDKSKIIGKTIFINRFDINYSKELIEFIETSPNRFIIVSNSQYRTRARYNSIESNALAL